MEIQAVVDELRAHRQSSFTDGTSGFPGLALSVCQHLAGGWAVALQQHVGSWLVVLFCFFHLRSPHPTSWDGTWIYPSSFITIWAAEHLKNHATVLLSETHLAAAKTFFTELQTVHSLRFTQLPGNGTREALAVQLHANLMSHLLKITSGHFSFPFYLKPCSTVLTCSISQSLFQCSILSTFSNSKQQQQQPGLWTESVLNVNQLVSLAHFLKAEGQESRSHRE